MFNVYYSLFDANSELQRYAQQSIQIHPEMSQSTQQTRDAHFSHLKIRLNEMFSLQIPIVYQLYMCNKSGIGEEKKTQLW